MFINITMPPSVRALQAWGIGEYKVKSISADNPLWIEDGLDIVVARGRPGMNELSELEIWKRNEAGELTETVWANWAVYDGNGGWVLKEEVATLPIEGADGERRKASTGQAGMRWETIHTPDTIARLAAEPRDLSLGDLKSFSEKGNSGSKPRFAYGFWYWHRITRPLAALLLLLCAVPIMQRTGREDNGDKALLVGLGLGFIFLIVDGAMATFATSGNITIMFAISIPLVLLLILGSYLVLRTESLTPKRS